jgi:hypothetical protein
MLPGVSTGGRLRTKANSHSSESRGGCVEVDLTTRAILATPEIDATCRTDARTADETIARRSALVRSAWLELAALQKQVNGPAPDRLRQGLVRA